MDEATTAARRQVDAARAALLVEVDELEAAARSAVDIPAKVRRSPGKAAATAGGIAFLGLGGPRRLLRGLRRAVRGGKDPVPGSVLPEEIERLVDGLGESAPAVRVRLEREFASFLDARKRKGRLGDDGPATLWRVVNAFGSVAASNAARKLVERAFAADRARPPVAPPEDRGA